MSAFLIYVTGLGLVAAVAWVVAAPFFGGESASGDVSGAPSDEAPKGRWQKQKEEALASIRDAEFDFQLGKLSEADYRTARARLEARALEAIRALEGGGR